MKFIIHADDFGMAQSINEACIELCQLQTLSSVSVMANMPYSDEVKELLPLEHVSLGLHSTFTEGGPMSSVQEVASLVDATGRFHRYPEMMRRAKAKQLKVEEIFKELCCQYETLHATLGKRLSFVDSHHSIHNKLLPFRHAFLQLGRKFQIPAIRTRQMLYLQTDTQGRVALSAPALWTLPKFGLRKVAANLFYRKRAGDYGKVFAIADGMLVQDALGAVDVFKQMMACDMSANEGKVFYAVTHPATRTDDLPESNLIDQRLDEFNLLRSEAFVDYVKQYPLVNFAELAE
jgi:predicted glycoside hydrolase/deacetylase ChbG (UPF0249 family)